MLQCLLQGHNIGNFLQGLLYRRRDGSCRGALFEIKGLDKALEVRNEILPLHKTISTLDLVESMQGALLKDVASLLLEDLLKLRKALGLGTKGRSLILALVAYTAPSSPEDVHVLPPVEDHLHSVEHHTPVATSLDVSLGEGNVICQVILDEHLISFLEARHWIHFGDYFLGGLRLLRQDFVSVRLIVNRGQSPGFCGDNMKRNGQGSGIQVKQSPAHGPRLLKHSQVQRPLALDIYRLQVAT
mmetsp:Transcript_43736/g.71095  ORF Transcript_43736/g.71095 Transcript_43736/m.71095 type:complete len:243 (+) Transcript_43736:1686-2414(+)